MRNFSKYNNFIVRNTKLMATNAMPNNVMSAIPINSKSKKLPPPNNNMTSTLMDNSTQPLTNHTKSRTTKHNTLGTRKKGLLILLHHFRTPSILTHGRTKSGKKGTTKSLFNMSLFRRETVHGINNSSNKRANSRTIIRRTMGDNSRMKNSRLNTRVIRSRRINDENNTRRNLNVLKKIRTNIFRLTRRI